MKIIKDVCNLNLLPMGKGFFISGPQWKKLIKFLKESEIPVEFDKLKRKEE